MRTKTSLVGLASLAISVAALAPAAHADRAVLNSQAGTIHDLGIVGGSTTPLAEQYAGGPWKSVTGRTELNIYAIGADGHLARVKSDGAASHDIPAALSGKTVVSVDAAKFHVGAVTSEGVPYVWGTQRTVTYSNLPTTEAGLGGKAVEIAVGAGVIAVRLDNGKVGALTNMGYALIPEFENVAEIDVTGNTVTARFDGGGLLGWGSTTGIVQPPAAIAGDQVTDPVVDFETGGEAIAVTQSGEVYTWVSGTGAPSAFGTNVTGLTGKIVDVAVSETFNLSFVRTDQDEYRVWGSTPGSAEHDALTAAVESLEGQDVASLTGGLTSVRAVVTDPQAPLAEATRASITGAVKVGQTLTGVPATFTGGPDAITYKWLVDGVEVAGTTPTTLLLDESMLGKVITFVSTAVRGGESLDSLSVPTAPVVAAENATSTTAVTISPSTGRYGLARTATVTVASSDGTPTGNVSVNVAGLTKTAPLVGGAAKVVLPKLNAGSHTLVASYAGDDSTQASSKTVKVAVSKASTSTKVSAVKVVKKGKKVTVSTKTAFPSGVSKTGTVKFVIKRGSKTVAKGTAKVSSSGVATFAAKKLTKKGKYKVTATYAGSSNVSASSGKKSFVVK